MRQKFIEPQREIEKPTLTVREFNIPVLLIERTIRKKTSKKMEDLSSIVNQLDQLRPLH
jgi:precorrin-6x reductase